ncbi:MAG TPA: hypothetical protein VIX73_35010, partial [Kofleriaceae bacterium]
MAPGLRHRNASTRGIGCVTDDPSIVFRSGSRDRAQPGSSVLPTRKAEVPDQRSEGSAEQDERGARNKDRKLNWRREPVGYAACAMTMPVLGGLAAIPAVRRLIELALDEDLGRGDATSRAVFSGGDAGPRVVADMVAREPIVVFGIDVAAAVFALVDPAIGVELGCAD